MKNTSITNNQSIPIGQIKTNFGKINKKESSFDYEIEGNLSHSMIPVTVIFKEASAINLISYTVRSDEEKNIKVLVFLSLDGNSWEKIPVLDDRILSNKREISLPFIFGKKIQIVFYKDEFFGFYNFRLEDLKINCFFKYQITTSSAMDRLWVGENLFDGRDDYGWASEVYNQPKKEEINIDLNQPYYVNEILLKSVRDFPNLFPAGFQVLMSNDKINWQALVTESGFYINSESWVSWKFLAVKTRYIKIIIDQLFRFKKDHFQAKILEADIRAIPENSYIEADHSSRALASELIPGDVILSEMNGASPNKVVQANDPRIRPGTDTSKGIVQFAKDGENIEALAVQANDRRLKEATEETFGIVQFARDGENIERKAVQGNDSRLKPASENSAGIVQLAKDGEESYNGVVRSNDSRLKPASENSAGIVQLAKDGENRGGVVVQANDKRLRMASNAWPGIVQLANFDEKDESKAIRSNDIRLEEATETVIGRVQFARDGENIERKAVQGNDSRLKPASEDSAGIVRYAPAGMKKSDAAIRADDPRLSDARKPLSHEHDYADKEHNLNSHKGSLNLSIDKKLINDSGYNISKFNDYPLSIENKEGLSAAFKGGVISRSNEQSAFIALSEKSNGIEVRTKEKASGIFFSEKDYGIHLPVKSGDQKGSGLSIYAEGLISVLGGIQIHGESFHAVAWDQFSSEVFHQGDLLTVGDSGLVEKMRNSKQYCIGVYVKNSDLTFYSTQMKKDKSLLIGISGIVPIRVTGKIKSGNFIGLNKRGDLRGVGEVVSDEKENKRIAIALESCDKEKERTIKAMLIR